MGIKIYVECEGMTMAKRGIGTKGAELESIICRCGKTFIARKSAKRKYCSHSCSTPCNVGKGFIIYKYNNAPYEVLLVNRKRKFIHTLIAEKALGRQLDRNKELVHHIDMNSLNNSNDNLLVCDKSYHMWLHRRYARRFAELHLR